MSGPQLLFGIFALATCIGAVAVVVSQNVVRMAAYLIVSLGSAAGLFFLLNADFIGATQVLIYVGGTIVLLIFGVMLTASGPFLKINTSPGDGVLGACVGLLFLSMLFATVLSVNWNSLKVWDSSSLYRTDLGAVSVAAWEATPADAEAPDKVPERSYFVRVGEGAAAVYRFRPDVTLSREEAAKLVNHFHRNVKPEERWQAPPAPSTVWPLGLAFIGSRPDRDLDPLATPAGSDRPVSTGYLLPFEIVSVHLLVVLVGAAYLARAKRRASARPVA
jgi:NADH-quinone oxidoreductase subunit J